MAHRDVCPDCGSSTGLGDVKCFKCGRYNSYFTSVQHKDVFKDSELAVPVNIVSSPSQFPPAALQWLYKAGIYDEDIRRQRIAYDPNSGRVIVPAIDEDGELRFYQMRDITNTKNIKYLTVGSMREFTIKYTDHEDDFCIVLVEDHISAIRLRKHCNVVCLSGTSVTSKELNYLVSSFSDIVFWLDADRPGQIATNKIYRQFKSLSDQMSVRNLFLKKQEIKYRYRFVDAERVTNDPKTYTDSQIRDIIENKTILLR